MNRNIKRYASYVAAVTIGIMAFGYIASSQADAPSKLVAICYRGHTMYVDKGALNYYLKLGATLGACQTSE
jgi:hypothetical protein